MTGVRTAAQLIQLFDPSDLDAIRTLFLGNLVDLETFSRTVQTFIPKAYTATEDMIDSLALAIIDLFEELDSDADGRVTWQDFISYYSEASYENKIVTKEFPQSKVIFKKMCNQTTAASGKFGKVDIESVLPNNAQFTELKGASILQVHIFNEQYFIVTELGVYQSDSTFLFPKLIFQPSPDQLQGSEKEKKAIKLDKKTKMKKKNLAIEELHKNNIIPKGSSITIFDEEVKDDFEILDNDEILRQMGSQPISKSTVIVNSIILSPLPFLVITTRLPLFIVVSLQGTQAISDPFRLPAMCTSLYWQSQNNLLYVGMESGAISAYKITMQEKQHEFLQMLKGNQNLQTADSMSLLNETLKQKDFDSFTLEDLCRIYPSIRQMIGGMSQMNKINRKEEVDALMRMRPEDLGIVHLLTGKIFNPHQSTMEQHGMKVLDVVRSDPKAFVKAKMLPSAKQTAIAMKKFGGVVLQVEADLIVSDYIVNGSVKKMCGSFGKFEQITSRTDVFRLIVAGGDGSVTIVDQELNHVCSFPELHEEGIVAVYCVNDYITSIGYNTIYQIEPAAIQQAYLGKCIKPEDEPNLQTTEPGQHIHRGKQKVDTSDEKLIKGDKLKTLHLIRFIEPPRPGKPVLSTFIMGNIIAVVDHEYMITFFHAITGAHLTRMTFSIGQLQGQRFGECTYNYNRDLAFMPIGKYMFYIRAISNEDVGKAGEMWSYLQDCDKEEKKSKGEDINKLDSKIQILNRLPIGSVCKELNQIIVNKNLNEVAIITGDYEITFYDLRTGQSKKIINVESLSRQLSDDDQLEQPMTEYTALESTDIANQFVDKSVVVEKDNVVKISDYVKEKVVKEKDADELLTAKRVYKSSLPQFLDPIEKMKLREKMKVTLIKILGDRILTLQTDQKGRVLYIIGTKGAITLYWKTGCLFDYTSIGIVGKKDEDNKDLLNDIENPFKLLDASSAIASGSCRIENDQISGGVTSYSLNIDLNKVLARSDDQMKMKNLLVTREQKITVDFSRKVFFIADSINPQECRVVAVSPSAEFVTAPINSRILANLNIVDCIKEMDSMFKIQQQFFEKYKSKNPFFGLYEGASKYNRTFRFVPPCLENAEKANQLKDKHKNYLSVILENCMNTSICEKLSSLSHIQSIDCSEALGLLAIGTSDCRVLLYDTQSIKFMKQGYISVPLYKERSAISIVKFLGQLPLIFVGLQDGTCFIYTTRPLLPAYTMLISFKHSSYSPVSTPLNYDITAIQQKFERHIQRQLLYFSDEARFNQKYNTVENDFIKMLYLENLPESKNLFINQHADYQNRNLLEVAFKNTAYGTGAVGQTQQLEESVGSSQQAQLNDTNRILSSRMSIGTLSALSNYNVETFKCGLINFPIQQPEQPKTRSDGRESISTIGETLPNESVAPNDAFQLATTNRIQSQLQGTVSALNQTAKENLKDSQASQDQAKQQQQEKDDMLNLYDYYKVALRDLVICNNQVGNATIQKNSRQRKIFAKIQGAVSILTVTKNLLVDMLESKNQIKVSRDISKEVFKKVNEEEDVDVFIKSKVPVSDKIKRENAVSQRTLKAIEDFKKSRFNVNQNKKEQEYVDQQQLSQYDINDMEAENLGVVYKYIQREDGTIRVPMRQISLETCRCNVGVSTCHYDQQRQLLVIGDQQGYITTYDMSEMLMLQNVVPAEIKKKQLYDEKTKRHYEQNLGFVEQQLDPKLLKSVQNPRLQPLINSININIVYQFRAHQEAVQALEPLPSNQNGQIISSGEDRRLMVWDLMSGGLLGSCQRVKLDDPPEFWEKLFREPLVQNKLSSSGGSLQNQSGQKKQKQKQLKDQLSLDDLKQIGGNQNKLLPPPLRIECPPPAEYPWQYLPQQLFSQSGPTLSSSAISFKQDTNVIQTTKKIVQQRSSVPTLDCNPASNLLKTTGLNPDLYSKYQSSWTVRAALRKASNNVLNGSEIDAAELLASSYAAMKIESFDDDTEEQQPPSSGLNGSKRK